MSTTLLLIAFAVVGYAYLGYPAVAWLRARFRPRPIARRPIRPSVSILIAARNEAGSIGKKLANLAEQTYPAELTELIVSCDGSDDGTPAQAERLRARFGDRLTVLVTRHHRGKPSALNDAAARARGDILVFTDARQSLSKDAVSALVENFADDSVGVAGGALVLAADAPAGLYWRYEAALRRWESAAGSTVGVSGALYAIRRELFQPLPPETILDDVLVPMRARLAGRRVVLDERAHAIDRAHAPEAEFRRKVRTLSGNFQLLALMPALMVPWKNPAWLNFVSHKLMRLVVPWALVTALVAAAFLDEPWRAFFFGAQVIAYLLAVAHWLGGGKTSRLMRLCETVVVLNVAAVVGTFRFLRHGRRLEW